jgi:hypothetical protein
MDEWLHEIVKMSKSGAHKSIRQTYLVYNDKRTHMSLQMSNGRWGIGKAIVKLLSNKKGKEVFFFKLEVAMKKKTT